MGSKKRIAISGMVVSCYEYDVVNLGYHSQQNVSPLKRSTVARAEWHSRMYHTSSKRDLSGLTLYLSAFGPGVGM